ncbi:MAG: GDP-mannose 4,6-dehydratase, partial [bacterium]|nr:GDP-mannose 4,6-dehydratase [bacterium]
MNGLDKILQSMNVLVTGGAGFIGSHLVEYLVPRCGRVRAFLRYSSRADIGWLAELPSDVLEEVELIRGDLKDPAS